jgi:predicted PurR-regulated permease PerM
MSDMTTQPTTDLGVARTAIEAVVRVGLVMLLGFWCFSIAQPFLVPLVWGLIIAVAVHPAYWRLRGWLGGRGGLAAFLVTLLALVVLIVPLTIISRELVDNVAALAATLGEGTIAIPPPPARLATLPLVGPPISQFWHQAMSNMSTALAEISPQLKVAAVWLLSLVAGAGFGILSFVVAIVLAGILLAHSVAGEGTAQAVATRLGGARGPELVELAERTVRSVARGIIGTALIQSMLAGIGLIAAGVPGAAFLTLICFLLSIVQIGPAIVLLGATVYVFSTSGPLVGILFLGWNIFVSLIDNFLKPMLMSRGGDVPLAVIFIGAVGGLLAHGLIGLFVGPVVFALGYRLFRAWVADTGPPAAARL